MDAFEQRTILHKKLLENIWNNMADLQGLLKNVSDHWTYEDLIYRYYHGSFKVYRIQDLTQKIVDKLMLLNPNKEPLNSDFMEIVNDGIGHVFELSHNEEWSVRGRLMLEAFFHAKYFLEMAVKYGEELEVAPMMLPSGWATLLTLYNIR